MFNVFKPITSEEVAKANPFAYKLTIDLRPNLGNVFWGLLSEAEKDKLGEMSPEQEATSYTWEKLDEYSKKESLYYKSYQFIEYYDSVSGLSMKSQYTTANDGTREVYDVDKFEDAGHILDHYSGFFFTRETYDKTRVSIYEDRIEIATGESFSNKVNTLFKVPLNDIVQFLWSVRILFKNTDNDIRTNGDIAVIKLPSSIEKKLKDYNIEVISSPEIWVDPFLSTEVPMSALDLKSWVKENNPLLLIDSAREAWLDENLFSSKIATSGSWRLSLKGVADMSIKLDIFYPEKEASRIDF